MEDGTCDSRGAKMASASPKYLSIELTQLLMKIIGFWNVQTRKERLALRFNYVFMLFIACLSIVVELIDLYHCRHDIYAATYTASSTMPIMVILMKTVAFTIRRKEIMWLIDQAQKHFWCQKRDAFGRQIMLGIDKKGVLFICSYIVMIYGASVIYLLYAILESVGKAEEDRILPFAFRIVPFPTWKTPYYECIFTLEVVCCIHTGISFTCFDIFLCILSMHLSGQFKILQNRLETIHSNAPSGETSITAYQKFKNCIARHHLLITYAQKLEYVFCIPLMLQLVISSVVLCVSGFQLFTDNTVFLKKLLFAMYIPGGLIQIYLITLNCNDIIEQSGAIGNAMYNCNWESTLYANSYQLRKDMIIVMLRTKRACYLTAGKFFPISLESFTKVLSATASYLTLLQTMEIEV